MRGRPRVPGRAPVSASYRGMSDGLRLEDSKGRMAPWEDWHNNPEDYTENGERKKWGRRYASITKAIPVPSSKSTQDYLKDSGGNLPAQDAKGCQRFDSDRIERYSTRRGTGIPESGGGRGHRRAVSEHAWAGRTRFAWRFHDLYSNRNILF